MSEVKNGSRNNHIVRVNSKKGLRSLKYQRLPIATNEDSVVSAHTTVISQALANNSKSTSRKNFYDSFSMLLMKLRGNRVNNNRLDDFGYSDEHGELGKVQYNELLWLELQAWHSGRTLEEADSELQEERNRTVDAVIREVKNFKFTTKERNGSISEDEKQSVCQKFSSSSRSSVCSYCEDPDDDMTSPLVKSVFDKEIQIEALREIVELLKKVDHAERLYCSLATLTNENNRYKDVMFMRNYKALVLWLNINKDIFHTMYMLADWIDLDFNDQLLWKDWFSNGLDLTCIRTNHSFKNRVGCTGEMVDALANFSSLLPIQLKNRRSKLLRKSNRSSTFNSSKITSTSRYRWFVESEMRKTGLFGLMKRIQNILCGTLTKVLYTLTPCEKSIFNELKECDSQLHKAFQNMNTDDAFPKSFDIDKEFIRNKMLGEGSQFGKACGEMKLPSVIEPYLFLAQVQLDIILECIRFRLEYKPKVEPSHLSLKQLIRECKELICGGVLAKHVFVNSVTPLFQEISGLHREHLQKKVKTFEEDLKSILNVYLDYLDRWYSLVCVMERAGEYLKEMDQEWVFVKSISVFVPGGAAKAAQKFCMIASNLLQSSGDFLKYSIDKCFTAYRKGVETESTPHQISVVCRKYKKIVSNMQVRVSKGLGFAKMLRKDLGVASKYTMVSGSFENILRKLKDTSHVKLDVELSVEYWIFASSKLYSSNNCKSYKMCLSLVFGEEVSSTTGYILLIKKPSTRIFWRGVRKNIDVCDKLQHALNNIEVESMVCVCTSLERNQIASMLEGCVKCVDEQTASHFNLQQALLHLNTTAKELADVIVTPTYHLDHNIMPALHRLDKDEKRHLKKICTETMNQYYSLCFEYLRETVRLYTGSMRKEMSVYFLQLSKLWIKFVTTYTSKGRGSRPRWAAQGMEFLMVTIEPIVLNQITEKEFQELKEEMQYCIAHIIGTPKPSKKYKIKGHKRSRSTTFSPPKPVNGLLSHTTSVPDLHSEEGVNSLETSFDNLDIEDEYPTVVRVRSAIQEIEERRTAKLQYMGVIGSETSQKPSLASELVINVRRVNFKWQLGSKIGEGQFGKVFSSVNLDTGERMAMKQIRFNPNDYGTIQSIADEITNIQSVQHDTLVKYFGVEVHKDEMLIFMEYCADGTLADISRLGLPEPMIRVYTAQIVQAINFLHDNGIIHRDIKGANIFISQSGLIKIGDFGSAVKLKDAVETSFGEVLNTRGTAAYMAPEVITLDKGQGYGRAADIWSLGCVVVEMVTGKHPWAETDNIYAIMFKVGTGQHPDYPKTFCDEGQNFLVNCFIPDPRHRWTATMLIDHPFVKVNQYFEHPI